MKRILWTVALCIAATGAFAQKKAVKEAQSIAKGSNPDFTEARTIINGALENPETKEDAQAWFVAGFIENQQFSAEQTKQMIGQQPDEATMYTALTSILPYFEKAYEYDQRPNAKGKVKPKYTKDMKSIVLDFADVSYVSSAGLRSVLKLKMGSKGVDLRIINAGGMTAEIFRTAGFGSLLKDA